MSGRLIMVIGGCTALVVAVVLLYANHEQNLVIASLDEKAGRLDRHCDFEHTALRWLSQDFVAETERQRSQGEYTFTSDFQRHFIEFTPCSSYRPNLDEARACIERHDRDCMKRIATALLDGMKHR